MQSLSRLSAVVVVAAVLLFASTCGGSSANETVSNEEAAAVTEDENSDDGVARGSDLVTAEDKSLDDYLGVAANFIRGGQGRSAAGGGGARDDNEQRAEEQRQIEQAAQLCMQSQGFEYIPQEAGTGLRIFGATAGQGISPQEYAETEGFGISTRFDALLDGDVDLTEETNANDEYVASLSEGEADAYQVALNGLPPVRNGEGQLVDPETGEVVQGGQRRALGGCRADAQLEVRGDFSVLVELQDEFVELEERIAADPRIAEISREWSDCMRAAGFAYETEGEARAAISEEFQPLFRSFLTSGAGGEGQQGQGRLQVIAGLELTAEQDVELAQIQDHERSLATASLGCAGDADEEVEEITARYEAEFVDANRDVLERVAS